MSSSGFSFWAKQSSNRLEGDQEWRGTAGRLEGDWGHSRPVKTELRIYIKKSSHKCSEINIFFHIPWCSGSHLNHNSRMTESLFSVSITTGGAS